MFILPLPSHPVAALQPHENRSHKEHRETAIGALLVGGQPRVGAGADPHRRAFHRDSVQGRLSFT